MQVQNLKKKNQTIKMMTNKTKIFIVKHYKRDFFFFSKILSLWTQKNDEKWEEEKEEDYMHKVSNSFFHKTKRFALMNPRLNEFSP